MNVEAGEFDLARAADGRRRAIADELGRPTLRWFSTYHDAAHQLLWGELAEASTFGL